MSGAVIVQGRYESSPSAVANGQHRDIQISATGVVAVSSTPSSAGTGLSFGSTANIVRIAPTASNNATVVQLVAASGATIVYPQPFFFKSKYYWVLGTSGVVLGLPISFKFSCHPTEAILSMVAEMSGLLLERDLPLYRSRGWRYYYSLWRGCSGVIHEWWNCWSRLA